MPFAIFLVQSEGGAEFCSLKILSLAHFLKGGLQKKKAELDNRKPIHCL